MAKGKKTCLNCEQVLPPKANYCAHCGQETKNLHVSFWEMVKDYLSSNFNFDTKLWITLRQLLFNPGFLLQEFMNGRRARYVPPIRLYFFISFVYFLLLGLDIEPKTTGSDSDGLVNLKVNGLTTEVAGPEVDSLITAPLLSTDLTNTVQIDSLLKKMEVTPTERTRHMARQFIKLYRSQDGFRQEFFKNLSLAMFFLMPVFALFFWLFASRPRLYYIDSLVFSVHVHAFFFLFSSFVVIIHWWFAAQWLSVLMVIMVVGYIVVGLKRLQQMSWKRAFGHTFLMLLLYMLIVGIALALLGIISAWRF